MPTTNRPLWLSLLVCLLAVACVPLRVAAQEEPASVEDRLKRLETENADLRALVEQMRRDLEALRAPGAEAAPGAPVTDAEIEDLLDVAAVAPQSAGAVGDPGGDPALNPLISFSFDYVANFWDRQPALYDADTRSRKRILGLRALEMNAKRGVSAYGDAFVTYGDHGHGFELEEGYIDINRAIPRANLRLGRWRTAFGPYNGVHEHQVPFVTYPRTVTNFFSFHGCTGEGAELTYLVPLDDYLELRLGGYRKLGQGTYVFSAS